MKRKTTASLIIIVCILGVTAGAILASHTVVTIINSVSDWLPKDEQAWPAGMATTETEPSDTQKDIIDPAELVRMVKYSPYGDYADTSAGQLEKLAELYRRDTAGFFAREAMIITGKLPVNQARITLDEITGIINEHDDIEQDARGASIQKRIDAIHGAPDYMGGSGILHITYWLTDDHTEAVVFMSSVGGLASYYLYGSDGELIETYTIGAYADNTMTTTTPRGNE